MIAPVDRGFVNAVFGDQLPGPGASLGDGGLPAGWVDQAREIRGRSPPDDAGRDVHDIGLDPLQFHPEPVEIDPFEGLADPLQAPARIGQVDAQQVRLAQELHVERISADGFFERNAFARDQRRPAPGLVGEDGRQFALGQGPERAVHGLDEIVPKIGGDASDRVGDAGPGRDQNAWHAQFPRHRGGMKRPRAPEGEKREIARVRAKRDRDHAHRARHLQVSHPDHRQCGLFDAQSQRAGDPLFEDAAHGLKCHAARHR